MRWVTEWTRLGYHDDQKESKAMHKRKANKTKQV